MGGQTYILPPAPKYPNKKMAFSSQVGAITNYHQENWWFLSCKNSASLADKFRGQRRPDFVVSFEQQGCRPEEWRSLEQADVDLEHARFSIRSGKSDAAKRTLRMRMESRSIFSRRLQTPGRWVFPSSNPARHIGNHQRLHAAVAKRSGVLCVPYDFRHTFASRAANDEGVPLPILAAILGHANLGSVMKYVHTSQEQMDREMIRLDAPRSSTGPVATGPNGEETGKSGNGREASAASPNRLNKMGLTLFSVGGTGRNRTDE